MTNHPHRGKLSRQALELIAILSAGGIALSIDQQQAVDRANKRTSDDDIRRHAWVATANGPFDPEDCSFTTICEFVRQARGLPPLHSEDDE